MCDYHSWLLWLLKKYCSQGYQKQFVPVFANRSLRRWGRGMFKQTTTYLLENRVLCKMSVCVHAHDHEAHVNLQWPCNNVYFSQRWSISFPDNLAGLLWLVLRGRLWLVQPKWWWLAQTSLPGLIKQAVLGSFSELIVRHFPEQPLWCCNTNPNNKGFFWGTGWGGSRRKQQQRQQNRTENRQRQWPWDGTGSNHCQQT